MTEPPSTPEAPPPSSTRSTTRFGARAVLVGVALALVAVPGALTLLLVEDRWAPLLSVDNGARDRLHNFAVTHTRFVGAMQLIRTFVNVVFVGAVFFIASPKLLASLIPPEKYSARLPWKA